MKNLPATEDRIWAVLSHLSALAFGMGILLPVIGWSEQRRKSNYASFHSLQALGYQSLGFTIWILSSLLIIVALLLIMAAALGSAGNSGGNTDAAIGRWMTVLFIVMIGFIGLYSLFAVIAAISCALGKEFHYPIMGRRLARYLEYDSGNEGWLIEDREDRWVAAMGHFSILVLLWGMLAPLTAWILQGKRSLFIKFQSLQTLVYQAVVTVLYFVALFVYFLGFFLLFAAMGLTGESQMGSTSSVLGFVVFIVASLIAFAIFLLIPLLHILGQLAGYRVLKGENYRYPLVGRLVEKRLMKQKDPMTGKNLA